MHCLELRLFYVLLGLLFGGQGTLASAVISGDDAFTIQHEVTGKCLIIQNESLMLGDCSTETARSWKWGSEHRLFHTGVSACLGLDVVSKTLYLTSCSSGSILEWRCNEGLIYTTYQMRLSATADGTVAAKRNTSDTWRRGGTSENICEQPYKTMHTSGGNANGVPCRFPFLYNNTWYHSCLASDDTHPFDWCSTTDNYDLDGKWGTCLKYEEGCGRLWNSSVNGRCYQVVSTAVVTWHEARDSCRSQGGDLLSISSPQELKNFEGRSDLSEQLWIGLNQLDWSVGWQWSDGTPLTYLPWDTVQKARMGECGVMKPNLHFISESCERKLPYICEKNSTQTQSSVELVYKPTKCESGWIPSQGYCFKFYGAQNESRQNYRDAQQVCAKDGAQLASIHSLEDVEMLYARFPGKMLVGWIGLKAESNMDPYKWEDGTDVTFTYWARSQPSLLPINTTRCVILADVYHVWYSVPCEAQRSFLCKKPGVVNDSAAEVGCPKDGDWRRHMNYCYKVDTRDVSYKESCKLIVNSKFEQAFINRLLKEQVSSKPRYFWTALQDTKGTGEYKWINTTGQESRVAFANWKWGESDKAGGCAVMGTNPLGQWIVKDCNEFKAGSICKIPVKTETTSTPIPEEPDLNATCFPGWVSRNGMKYCYKVFHEERLNRKRSWAEAQRFCEGLGAHLPSFTEEIEMSAFHDILRDSISDDRYFWIGLNRRNPNNDNRWEWSDGQPVSMTIFPQEFHEDDEYNRDCTAFKSVKQRYLMFYIFLMAQAPQRPFYPRAFHCDAKLEWVCQIARGETPKNPEWYNPDGHHNTSLFVDGQEFWFVSDPKLSYEEANTYCKSSRSKLATPRSITAARRLREYLLKNSEASKWWVDVQESGLLLPLHHPNWHYYNLFLGRCTSLSSKSIIPDYKTSCITQQPFVCETLNITSAENRTEEHPLGKPCEKESSAFRDKCYTVISPKYMSFNVANEYCQTLRGSLVSIQDQAEQDFITTLLVGKPQKIWIGLSLKFHDIRWVDHTPVKFLNFNPLLHGQLRPMQINMFEQDELKLCAYMFNNDHSDMLGTWDYMPCTDLQNLAICQHYADKPAASEVTEGVFQVNDHKFKLILKENLTWFDALELCKRNQMDLASVANAYEQAVLSVNVTKAGFPLWIGLYSEDDEHYHWTDHSHTLFSRWGQEAIAGKCVYLNTDGYWKATECEERLQGAFCHIPQVQSDTKKENSTRCPHKSSGPNWIPFKNNCYTFLLSSARWQELDRSNGEQTCQLLVGKGELVTIRNEEENEFIRTQLQPFKDLAKFVWLGMSSNNDQQLKWYDGTNVQFSNWRNGRPDITKTFMAGLSLNGDWYMTEESDLFGPFKQRAIVVCKIETDSKEEYKKDPVDVETHQGYKYHLVTKKLNWFQAVKECALMEGHLMSIYDERINGNVSLIARRYGFPLWIGLSSLDSSRLHYEWSDGTAVIYNALGDASTIAEPKEKCVYVDTKGSWTVVSCYEELEGAICYTDKKRSRTSASSNKSCPDSAGQGSWLQFKDHCYAFDMTFYNYSVYTMAEAKHVCEKLDPSSELLTIKSQEENIFVSDHMADSTFITSRVWLNLNPASSGNGTDASWMDENALQFSPWVQTKVRSGCAVLESTVGRWNTTDCASSRSRVVCKAPAKSEGVPVALIFFIIVLLCIVGVVLFVVYKRTRHRYFSTVRYQRNFDEADSTSMIGEVE